MAIDFDAIQEQVKDRQNPKNVTQKIEKNICDITHGESQLRHHTRYKGTDKKNKDGTVESTMH